MKYLSLLLVITTQLNAALVYSDANTPLKWAYQEVVAGSLDTGFGTGGKVTTTIGVVEDIIRGLAIQSDDKIVAVGESYNGSNDDIAVVRYNTDGSLDTGFGSSGIKITAIGSSEDHAYAVAIQSDGKLVVVGDSYNGSDYDFVVLRYNIDGSLDSSFGTGGIKTTPVGSVNDWGYGVAIQSDGKIVVAGHGYVDSAYRFVVMRHNTDGSLDSSFGTEGIKTTQVGTIAFAHAVAIQTDGKIVVAGESYNGSNYDFAVVRYNTDGSLDSSFGTGGIKTTPVGEGQDYVYALSIQPDGKLIVAGYSHNGDNYDFAVVRYNTDGSLDSSFGTGGVKTTSVGSGDDQVFASVLQSDGKIVLGGMSYNISNDFALVRYNNNISPFNLITTSAGLLK